MATTINAGRVRFVSRGTYNNSTQYYLFDLVDYNGSSYIAKENSLGNLPTNTQYWQLIAEKGNTGSTGQTGPVGPTGNGISSITKTGTSGLVDTYTITYTNGNTTTFTVTNGEDADTTEITNLKNENSRLKGITNALPKISGEDTSLTLTNTANAPLSDIILKGNTKQQQYSGKNLFQTLNYSNSNWLGYSINADTKYIIISGSKTQGAMLIEAQNKIYTLKANTTYTLTLFYISGDITRGNLYLNIQDWGNSDYPNFHTPSISSTNKKNVSITFTTDSTERTYNNCGVYLNRLTCSNLVVACQLEINSTATSYEQYVGGMPSPNPDYPQEVEVVTGDNTITISNADNTASQEFPISLGSLELCKIGNYQDYFYKRGSKWYLHKEIGKKASYNGETITTSCISTTGELSTGAKVYYVVNSTDTEITDTTLISQLNALYNAYTYNDTTNISQTNANLPFIINAEAFKKIS